MAKIAILDQAPSTVAVLGKWLAAQPKTVQIQVNKVISKQAIAAAQ